MIDLKFDKQYNLIYSNWGLNYIYDQEAILLLQRARNSLLFSNNKKPGTIILKETISDGECKYVKEQNMFLRTTDEYFDLFKRAGYKVMKKSTVQKFDS